MPVRIREQSAREQPPSSDEPFHSWTFPDGAPAAMFYRRGKHYMVRFPGWADFDISVDGRDVVAWPSPAADSATLQHLFLNQVIPLALSRQGQLVLHASAIDAGGRAVAFVGASGRGKSTLTADFARAGLPFLADDGLQLEWRGQVLHAVPNHPSIRLWEDSREAVIGDLAALADPVLHTTKARVIAGDALQHRNQSRPLSRFYFLGPGSARAPEIHRMSPATAAIELVRHSFLLDVAEKEMLAAHFNEISRLAELPIHYHLDYPRSFGDLAFARGAVLHHASLAFVP